MKWAVVLGCNQLAVAPGWWTAAQIGGAERGACGVGDAYDGQGQMDPVEPLKATKA